MNLQAELNKTGGFKNLELLAKQVVEGFIAGMHKSPFHGFSAEFAEHKIYMLKLTSCLLSVMMKKRTCVVI